MDAKSGDGAGYVVAWQGTLREVHQSGHAEPRVALGEVMGPPGAFAIGPLAGLAGEITAVDGRAFVARVGEDGRPRVVEEVEGDAPFMVYGDVRRWRAVPRPEAVRTLDELETWLRSVAGKRGPVPFKIRSSRSTVRYHIMHNPDGGYTTSRPHRELMHHFELRDVPMTLIGVFSTAHGGVFTHHDAAAHIHMVSDDGEHSGHVDGLELGEDAEVWVGEG